MKRRIISLILAISMVASLIVPLAACGKSAVDFEVRTEGFATSYVVGAEIDYSPLAILVNYDDGSQETIGYADFEEKGVKFTPVSTDTAGEKNIRIEFAGKSKLVTVTITAERAVTGIEIDDTFPLEYTVGDVVDYTKLKVNVYYNDNTSSEAGVSDGVTHTSIDTSSAGEKDFTVTYAGLSDTAKVTVSALPAVESVEIKEGTFDTEYETADEADYGSIVLIVKYDNGTTEEIGVFENSNIVLERPEISVAGDYTLKITFGGKSVSVEFNVKTSAEEVESVELTAESGALRYKQGDTVDYKKFTAKVTYEDVDEPVGLPLTNALVIFTPIDTSKKEDTAQALSVSVGGKQSNALDVTVAYVKSLKIEGLKTDYVAGETFDPSCTVVLVYSDGAEERTTNGGAGITYNSVDVSAPGDKEFTVTYTLTKNGENLNSVTCTVTVAVSAAETIASFQAPASYTAYGVNKEISSGDSAFSDRSAPYMAGDDNPLILLPVARDSDMEIMNAIQTKATVQLKNEQGEFVAVEGADLAAYVSIDSAKNYYDFTEAAVGKTFRITVRPSEIYKIDTTAGSATFTVEVLIVDGYNVYDAKGLSAFDNRTGSAWDDVKPYTTNPWDDRPLSEFEPASIVLHANNEEGKITVTNKDIPSGFYWEKDDPDFDEAVSALGDWVYTNGGVSTKLADLLEGSLREGSKFPGGPDTDTRQSSLYERVGSGTVYGNYMSVQFGYMLEEGGDPVALARDLRVVYDRDMYNGKFKGITETHFSAFSFNTINIADAPQSQMYNVRLIGNTQRSEFNGPQSIMMLHNASEDLLVENVVGNGFFVNVVTDLTPLMTPEIGGGGNLTIDKCKFFDSFSNMIYDFGTESVTVRDSVMQGAGGPLILSIDNDNRNAGGGAATPTGWTVIDSDLENWVTGQEAWFTLNNVGSIAGMLKGLASQIQNTAYRFTDSDKMNIIAALICTPDDLLENDAVIYSKFSIKDSTEKQEFDTAGKAQGYGAVYHYAPLLQCGTSWGYIDSNRRYQALDPQNGVLPDQTSKYLGIYYSPLQRAGSPGYISVILEGKAL